MMRGWKTWMGSALTFVGAGCVAVGDNYPEYAVLKMIGVAHKVEKLNDTIKGR
jgi:drug/metabolite transporter (DMT)-like permease